MNPELHARLYEPIVGAVLHRLQLHAEARQSFASGLADLPPTTIEGALKEFVEDGVLNALKVVSAHQPDWIPSGTFDEIEKAVAEVVGNAAVALYDRLIALGRTPLPGDA